MVLSRVLRLNTGGRMPALGLGTFSGGENLCAALDYALHLGYRHVDTAWSYGTQPDIGQVIGPLLANGTIKREELFITTKVPGNFLTDQGVKHVVEESLEQLKTPFVDMLLIHSPFGRQDRPELEELQTDNVDYVTGWRAMEKVLAGGLTKAIGVSNTTVAQMDNIEEKCKVRIANAQSECHCYLQQAELRRYCMQMGIVFTAYGPLGAGARPDRHRHAGDPPPLLEDEAVTGMAERLGKTPAQLLLRYLLDLGVAVIPKSCTPERIKENAELVDISLSKEDREVLKSLNIGQRYFQFAKYKGVKHYPENEPF